MENEKLKNDLNVLMVNISKFKNIWDDLCKQVILLDSQKKQIEMDIKQLRDERIVLSSYMNKSKEDVESYRKKIMDEIEAEKKNISEKKIEALKMIEDAKNIKEQAEKSKAEYNSKISELKNFIQKKYSKNNSK